MADTNAPTKPSPAAPSLPGIVLGPDGKPCKPCTSFRDWTKGTKKKQSGEGSKSSSSTGTLAAASALGSTATLVENSGPPPDCPPDVEVLGRSTWTFLHTAAAYYPENPTPSQKSSMLSLLQALPNLYPCSWCADHLKVNMKQYPITEQIVSSRGPLSRWLCERHNDVNVRLGKASFDCNKTDERWKDGPADGSCD